MSTWFSQNIIYGYKTTYEEFKKHVDEEDFDAWDKAMAENNEDGWGWIVDDDFVVYGKIVMSGEDFGNHTLLAAESGIIELPKFEKILPVNSMVYAKFPKVMPEDIKYYVVGTYS